MTEVLIEGNSEDEEFIPPPIISPKEELSYEVSLFPVIDDRDIESIKPLNAIQQMKLNREITKYIKTLSEADEDILNDQMKCWLHFMHVIGEKQQKSIKDAAEKFGRMPVKWCGDNCLEVDLRSSHRLQKKSS